LLGIRSRAFFVCAMPGGAKTEALAFGRHLVGVAPPPELLARYERARARLFPEPPDRLDGALLAFARGHPWSVGPLDAATALVRPQSRLRANVLVMAAVLETTPRFADTFLPRETGRAALLARLAAIGLGAAARLLVGLVLYGAIRMRA
jgi:hypothetical protein